MYTVPLPWGGMIRYSLVSNGASLYYMQGVGVCAGNDSVPEHPQTALAGPGHRYLADHVGCKHRQLSPKVEMEWQRDMRQYMYGMVGSGVRPLRGSKLL